MGIAPLEKHLGSEQGNAATARGVVFNGRQAVRSDARRDLTSATEPPMQLIEQQINNGRGVERQQLRYDESTDNGNAERAPQLRTWTGRQCQRNRSSKAAMVVIRMGRKRSRQAS